MRPNEIYASLFQLIIAPVQFLNSLFSQYQQHVRPERSPRCASCRGLCLEDHLKLRRHMELLSLTSPDSSTPCLLPAPRSFSLFCYRLLWVDGVAWCESKALSNRHTFSGVRLSLCVASLYFSTASDGFLNEYRKQTIGIHFKPHS